MAKAIQHSISGLIYRLFFVSGVVIKFCGSCNSAVVAEKLSWYVNSAL